MLRLVNTFGINEIEFYIEQVSIKRRVNPLLGNFIHSLLGENDNVKELD